MNVISHHSVAAGANARERKSKLIDTNLKWFKETLEGVVIRVMMT